PDDVGHLQASAGAQHAEGFGEDLVLVGAEVDDAVGDDDVDGRVRDGEMLDLAEAELDVGGPDLLGVAAGERDHLGGHVNAVDAAGLADHLRGEEAVDAAAGAEVEDDLAAFERGDGGGVAAAEGDIGDGGAEVADIGVLVELRDVGDGGLVGFAAAAGVAGRGVAAGVGAGDDLDRFSRGGRAAGIVATGIAAG